MDATNAECRRCSVGGAGGILVRTRDGSGLRKWRGQLDGPEPRHGRVGAWVACCSSRPRSALHNAPDLAFMLPVYVSRQAPSCHDPIIEVRIENGEPIWLPTQIEPSFSGDQDPLAD